MHRFKFTHTPLSHSCRLVRQLTSIVGVLSRVVNRFRNKLSMGYTITSQFIGNNFPRLTNKTLQEPLKEALCSLSITSLLKICINNFTILVYRAPQIMLLPLNLHEDFINEECIAISLLFSP